MGGQKIGVVVNRLSHWRCSVFDLSQMGLSRAGLAAFDAGSLLGSSYIALASERLLVFLLTIDTSQHFVTLVT